jgi:hypothetical protein
MDEYRVGREPGAVEGIGHLAGIEEAEGRRPTESRAAQRE